MVLLGFSVFLNRGQEPLSQFYLLPMTPPAAYLQDISISSERAAGSFSAGERVEKDPAVLGRFRSAESICRVCRSR